MNLICYIILNCLEQKRINSLTKIKHGDIIPIPLIAYLFKISFHPLSETSAGLCEKIETTPKQTTLYTNLKTVAKQTTVTVVGKIFSTHKFVFVKKIK